MVLKVFDIVYVTTAGNSETNVVAVAFVQQIFQFGENGRASAIAVHIADAAVLNPPRPPSPRRAHVRPARVGFRSSSSGRSGPRTRGPGR